MFQLKCKPAFVLAFVLCRVINSILEFYQNIHFATQPFFNNFEKGVKRNIASIIFNPGNVSSFLVNQLP